MAQILSQDEIDALLNTVSAGKEEPEEKKEDKRPRTAVTYDFKHPNRVSKDQIRTLENIHDDFSGHLGSVMSNIFRAVLDIELVSVDQITYSEFIMSLVAPSCSYTFSMSPLEGLSIIDFNPALAFAFIERLFGGAGKQVEIERELTGIERAAMKRISTPVFSELGKAWARIVPVTVEAVGFETNPQFIQVVPPGETVIAITFRIKLMEATGILTICYPYVVLEPIAERLSGQSWIDATRKKVSNADQDVNKQNLSKVEATVSSRLAECEITVKEFLDIKIGDVVTLGKKVNGPVTILVEGEPIFRASPGLIGKKLGFKVTELMHESSV